MKVFLVLLSIFLGSFARASDSGIMKTGAAIPLRGPVLKNPYVMSLTSAVVFPKEDRFRRSQYIHIPQRRKVPYLSELSTVRYTYRLQRNSKSPFVFIVPGTGGSEESAGALTIAEKMFGNGYHVVTLSNPFSWGFAVAGSRRGLPGFTPEDSRDLYEIFQGILRKLQQEHGIRPSSYSLIGYSLGGLQAVFLKDIDDSQKKFSFSKVLSINPPVDLLYSVQQLDDLYELGEKLSPGRKMYVRNRLFQEADKLPEGTESGINLKAVQGVFDSLKFTQNDLAFIIGGSFRDSLRDVIYASQQVKDLGILKSPISQFRRNQRIEEASRFSYETYMRQFVYPQINLQRTIPLTFEELNVNASMYVYKEFIKNDPRLYLIHSSDDFIINQQHLQFLKEAYGERSLILPFGGHCGSLGFPQLYEAMANIFALNPVAQGN